ncbi:hypothetical protein NLO413_0460 [Candidatus Neoehrlichia lotoris str. RAC413]|uniref:Uncharacterized protein n=1 Tax=Candidatus Neoehrlichia procyonis str. RAC413 TaxID=1359163 RepID=A0A0F3NQC6_9RICK|nr:hypothetical protein NLO413_0460 [Candidatus Neoehrlichia lotoris str. RAC413]
MHDNINLTILKYVTYVHKYFKLIHVKQFIPKLLLLSG